MDKYLHGGHTRYDIKIHVVWITKYRYPVLRKEIGYRLRDLLRQGCEARNIGLLAGHIRPDHVHLLLSIAPTQSVSQVVKYLKGISDEDIISLNLPTGVPYVFEFNEDGSVARDFFLGDQEAIAAKMNAVANQGTAKK